MKEGLKMNEEKLHVLIKDKNYKISSVILSFFVFIIFMIMLRNESGMPRIHISFILSCVTCVISFLTTNICSFYLCIGNKITNMFIKILYYFALPILLILIWIVLGGIGSLIFHMIPGLDLGHALMFVFGAFIVAIFLIVPYIQALIFLFCGKFKSK